MLSFADNDAMVSKTVFVSSATGATASELGESAVMSATTLFLLVSLRAADGAFLTSLCVSSYMRLMWMPNLAVLLMPSADKSNPSLMPWPYAACTPVKGMMTPIFTVSFLTGLSFSVDYSLQISFFLLL